MTAVSSLHSDRLTLVASTAAHVRTELEHPARLALLLDAHVSGDWPSGEYDRDAMQFFLTRFEEGGEAAAGWYGWYALASAPGEQRALVGNAGFFGPPADDGTVEMGYSVLPAWQRRGYASEMVALLAAHAFTFPGIEAILAHTAEDNIASSKVLARSGFAADGPGQEPGTLRFIRRRP